MRKGMRIFVNGRFVMRDIFLGSVSPQDMLIGILVNLHPVAGAFRLEQLRTFVRRVHRHNPRFRFPYEHGRWQRHITGTLRNIVGNLKTAGLLKEFSDGRLSCSRFERRRFLESLVEQRVFPEAESLASILARTFEQTLMTARLAENKRTLCGRAA